jgi:outer membrane protein assembly factor BamB
MRLTLPAWGWASTLLIASSCRLLDPSPAPRNRVLWSQNVRSPAGDFAAWHGVPGSDGRFAFVETDTGVIAIDPATGSVAWAVGLWHPRDPASAWILHRHGELLLADRDRVWALSAQSGAVRWSRNFGADSLHQLDLLGADDANVYVTQRFEPIVTAARQADGSVVWQRTVIPDSGFSSIISGMGESGDTLYIGGARNRAVNGYPKTLVIVGVSTAAGAPLMQFEKSTPNTASSNNLVVEDSLLILSDFLGSSAMAVNRFTATKAWEYQGDAVYFGPDYAPVIVGDTAFVASNDRYVYAIDRHTGALYWKVRTRSSISSFALCGRFILTNNMAIGFVDRGTRRVEGYYVAPNGDESGFTTSGFAVFGTTAVVTGATSVYGLDCR